MFCHGVPVEYGNGSRQRNTHPMRMPKVKTERLTFLEKELLREIAMLVPMKQNITSKKVPKKGIPRGGESKLISLRSGTMTKQRSMLGETHKIWDRV